MTKPILFPFIQSGCLLFCSLMVSIPTAAQNITIDNTTLTRVTSPDGNNFKIDGGDRPEGGANLFHSFREFSVPTDGSAFFNNANDIVNIFSRVTGDKISSIDGLIKANGSANLFLINPAGIIFRENARLDIGGSFLGSTASSILFPDGELSALDRVNSPLLTINAPIGLRFRDNPKPITNKSVANNLGLRVNVGESISLVGGNINFERGIITAPAGNIYLGGLAVAGEIGIEKDGSLSFPSNLELNNIVFRNGAIADVSGAGGGLIEVNANSLELNQASLLRAGIKEGMGSANVVAGDIRIDVGDRLFIDRKSMILSQIEKEAKGNSGDIEIDTVFLEAKNHSEIATYNKGMGNAGNIRINARDSILLEENTFVRTQIDKNGIGNAGNIDITTTTLTLNYGLIVSKVKNKGQGSTGNLTIVADEATNLIEGKIDTILEANSVGRAGSIRITTPSLSLEDGSRIRSITLGRGNTGDIILTTREFKLVNNSRISSTSFAQGDAGDIIISSDRLIVDDSGISTNLNDLSSENFDAIGDGGNITINTDSLDLTNGSLIDVSTSGRGDVSTNGVSKVGNITIKATDVSLDQMSLILSQIREMGSGEGGKIEIIADNISLKEFSLLSANTRREATGNAGNIILDADKISITEGAIVDGITENNSNGGNITIKARVLEIASGGKVITSTDGDGNSGNITLQIANRLDVDGRNAPLGLSEKRFDEDRLNELETQTGLFANTSKNSTGDSGIIYIGVFQQEGDNLIPTPNKFTEAIIIANRARISADSQGIGNGGIISIRAEDLTIGNQASISAAAASGTGGNINLIIKDKIALDNNSFISAAATGTANGGDININTDLIVAQPNQNSDIFASAEQGMGGRITIDAEGIFGIQVRPQNPLTNDIDASGGVDGEVIINNPDVNITQGSIELPANVIEPETLSANACSGGGTTGTSNFSIAGKSGVPPEPTEPFTADAIVIEGKSVSLGTGQAERVQREQIKPLITAQGEIYPARGIIFQENGEIILTAYPTDNVQRTPYNSPNCGKSQS